MAFDMDDVKRRMGNIENLDERCASKDVNIVITN